MRNVGRSVGPISRSGIKASYNNNVITNVWCPFGHLTVVLWLARGRIIRAGR